MSGFHGYNAIDSFVLDMGNNLHSSSGDYDNDEYDNWQDNDVLFVITTNVIIGANNGRELR